MSGEGRAQEPLRTSLSTCLEFSQACDFILPTQGPCSGYFPGFHAGSLSVPEALVSKVHSRPLFPRTVEVNLLLYHCIVLFLVCLLRLCVCLSDPSLVTGYGQMVNEITEKENKVDMWGSYDRQE